MPTMDFEVYLNTNAPAAERERPSTALFANEDAAGIEYAVVMPSPTPKPDNLALFETAGKQRRAILCCQVNPNDGEPALAEIRQAATEWGMRVLKIMPAIYQVRLSSPLALTLMTTGARTRPGGQHPLGQRDQPPAGDRRPVPSLPRRDRADGPHGLSRVDRRRDRGRPRQSEPVPGHDHRRVRAVTIERAIEALGPERVVYGSNWPNLYSDLAVEAIRRQNSARSRSPDPGRQPGAHPGQVGNTSG